MASNAQLQMRRIREKTERRLSFAVRSATADLLFSVAQKTPVKTGRLRNGWIFGTEVPPVFTPPPGKYESDPSLMQRRALERMKLLRYGQFPILTGYVVNNVWYGRLVEFGLEGRIPRLMVQRTIPEWRMHVANAVAAAIREIK